MINVYSFQKMIQNDDGSEDKNISKTSHFIFGQNYKKLIANSKANFDFRRFLQKHSNTKKNFATIAPKESVKRSPLEQVNPFDTNYLNNPNNIQSKAFKIRCYSRKTTQQKQNKKQQEVAVSKMFKYKPRIFPMKEVKVEEKQKRAKTNIDFKKCIRMHKMDNFEELECISNNIKVYYNKNQNLKSDKNSQKAIVFDINYLVHCIKAASTKLSQKDKQHEYFIKKILCFIKKIVQDKFNSFTQDRDFKEDKPQLIFKSRSQQQIFELIKIFEQCEFKSYYCIFCVQNKCIQSTSTYSLTKISNLAQNITIVDSMESLTYHPPLLNSRHFVGFVTFNEKANFGISLESLFNQNESLEIRFSAQQFEGESRENGCLVQIPYKQYVQKVKQKRAMKQCRKCSRQIKQRCHSSYQGSHCIRGQDRNLQGFKQKMLKYIKIISNEPPSTIQSKRSRQILSTTTNTSQDIMQCMTGRQKLWSSKTNNQIVSQLVKLNMNIHKQIVGYQKKIEQVNFDVGNDVGSDVRNDDGNDVGNDGNEMIEYLRFDKIYVNWIQ